jgi:hypothetical protein
MLPSPASAILVRSCAGKVHMLPLSGFPEDPSISIGGCHSMLPSRPRLKPRVAA